MLIWGVVWGAVIALLVDADAVVLGAALGWFAAWTLRRSLRAEVDRRIAAATMRPPEAQAPEASTEPVKAAAAAARPAVAPAAEPITEPITAPAAASATEPIIAPAADLRPGSRPLAVPAWLRAARDWLFGGNTVVRLGAVLLFMGLAFLARYAVERQLLPPELRVAAIGAAGIALLLAGFRIARRDALRGGARAGYAWTLQGAGVAVLYLAVFAAYRLYALVPAAAALALMTAVCVLSAVVALRQEARALAALGLAGGFLAPVLASSGEGSHVALFGYYALLDAAMLGMLARRGWRELAWIGFVGTFGVATAWGVLVYRPALYASTQPFLALFFAIFVAAALLLARRTGRVDTTLVFGTPLAAFGLQAGLVRDMEFGLAFAALAVAAVYVMLALAIRRGRTAAGSPGPRAAGGPLLADAFVALGVGFATLAVPLALDARWTSAVWALEGAAAFWVGQRQGRWLPRLAGIALQVPAWFALLAFLDRGDALVAPWPLAHAAFVGAMLLALPALWIAYRIDKAPRPTGSTGPAGPTETGAGFGARVARAWAVIEPQLSVPLFFAGAAWWLAAIWLELDRRLPSADPWTPAYGLSWQAALTLLGWVASAHLSWHVSRRLGWAVASWPAFATLPLMLVAAAAGLADHLSMRGGLSPIGLPGAVAWSGSILLHLAALHGTDRGGPRWWFGLVHGGHAWLAALLLAHATSAAARSAGLSDTAWPSAGMLVAVAAVLLATAWAARHAGPRAAGARWPLDRFATDIALIGGLPLAVVALVAGTAFALTSDGAASPLRSLPLLNPTDLSVALALAAVAAWTTRLRSASSSDALPDAMRGVAPWAAIGAVGFVLLNTAWLRAAHYGAGVPWRAEALFASPLVQAGYALLWTVAATALMVLGRRRQARVPWMAGAALLALTVAKLFLVDLSNAGTTERIVAFIGVGLVMLLVGWIAPLPPARGAASPEAAR